MNKKHELKEVVAVIDCGTNSTRLLITDGEQTFERLTRITRLGEGLTKTNEFGQEPIARVLETLSGYRRLINDHGATRFRVVATSAARDALNRESFFDAVEEEIGIRPELLSGVQEGRLAFEGAIQELEPSKGPYLVVDIGGGSTEFIFGTETAEMVHSCDIGCVRLTEQWIHNDPPLPEELHACLSVAESYIDEMVREIPQVGEASTLVGLSGTVSCIAALEIGLACYDREKIHHFNLTRGAIEDVFRTIATENNQERLGNPGLTEDRVSVIVAGTAILTKVMRQLNFETCLVSDSDLLDGLAVSLF
tara:strand:+ start:87 stop:1010 length:924 start_codon:yes stop_codon:yes gene_type:complete